MAWEEPGSCLLPAGDGERPNHAGERGAEEPDRGAGEIVRGRLVGLQGAADEAGERAEGERGPEEQDQAAGGGAEQLQEAAGRSGHESGGEAAGGGEEDPGAGEGALRVAEQVQLRQGQLGERGQAAEGPARPEDQGAGGLEEEQRLQPRRTAEPAQAVGDQVQGARAQGNALPH